MEHRLKRLLFEELKNHINNSEYIRRIVNEANQARDLSEFITVISQGIIALESSRKESFDILTERRRLGL